MPKDDSSYFYNIKRLNIVFAISSILFMGMVVWTVLDDANREWKHWQRLFQKIEFQKTKRDLEQAREAVDQTRWKELQSFLAQAKASLNAKKSEMLVAKKASDEIDARLYVVNSEYQIQKSLFDTAKYQFEEASKNHPGGADKEKARMDKYGQVVAGYNEKLKGIEKEKAQREGQETKLLAKQQEAQDQIAAQTKEISKLAKKLAKVQPSLINSLRDIPMLDFLAPTLRISQILPEGLTDDYNFVKVPKVDRCTTCHVAIDKVGYQTAKQPFTTHPALDLYLGGNSPHAMEKFGCTSCHLGNGRGTSFETAVHTPGSEAQAAEWKKKYHWSSNKHWAWPMLPKTQVEANCISCHTGVMEVPKADRLNEARLLFARMGCVGCHATEGFNDLRKIGPALTHLGSKVEAAWLPKWIENPKSFHADSRMPRFFGLSNAPMDERQQAIIGSIAAYLLDKSEPVKFAKTEAATGDAKRGEALVAKVGCLGCHTVGNFKANNFGPDLDGSGSKLKKQWLIAWLKDPKKLFPQTKMPNMRLSDREAADIAHYLLSLKNEAFDAQPGPQVGAAALDGLVLEELRKKSTDQDAHAQSAAMDEKQKQLLVGQKMILNYGCFGCHDIGGFEAAKKIGAELTEEGSKPVERFDFGFLPIEHTREGFFRQKLSDPRSFDMGKVKTHTEKLKMPQFDFTPEQVDLLILHLTSLTKHSIPMDRRRLLNPDDQAVEEGRKLVRNFNCQGCHVLDGKGGNIAETLDDKGLAPPALEGEGKKVKGDWLFTFLHKPATIRPWLHLRMPTFGFTDEQATVLVRYFQGKDRVGVEFKSLEKNPVDQEMLYAGKDMFGKLQCLQCHQVAEGSKKSPADLAPDLGLAADRLREHWIVEWLKDPQVVQPGTRMPTFFPEGQSPLPKFLGGNVDNQIKALKTFIVHYKPEN